MYTPSPPPVSPAQDRLLSELRQWFRRHPHAPTIRELQSRCGYKSPRAVSRHLDALEKAGFIRRKAGQARTVQLTDAEGEPATVRIPFYGTIPAGFADYREQESDGCLSLDIDSLELPHNARMFALRVRGDSMIGVNICDGDTVIMEFKEPVAGNIVAALIDGETTLKRYLLRRGRPYLKAENPAYADLIPAQELVIQGVLVALMRSY